MLSDPHLRHFLNEIRWAVLGLLLVLSGGTVGYWYFGEGKYSLFDCFYMTMITLTTIGFSEIVDLSHSPMGRLFTVGIALAGIGLLTYVLTSLTAFLVEGDLNHSFKRRKMLNHIAQMRDHYILCGCTGASAHLVAELKATDRPFVVVAPTMEEMEKNFPGRAAPTFVVGDPANQETLTQAGIQRAQGLFSVLWEDFQNVMVVLTARHMNPRLRIIAQCRDRENESKLKWVGADAVVSLELIGGLRMASEMVRPTVVTFLDTMLRDQETNLRIEEIALPASLAGKTLADLDLAAHPELLLLAIRDDQGWRYNPPGAWPLRAGARLVVMTTPAARMALEKTLGA